MYIHLAAAVAVVTILVGIIWDSSRFLSRGFDVLFRKFPRSGEFAFGAMFGFYAGVVPAIVVYALVHQIWAAGVIDGSFVLAGGLGWTQVCGRSRDRKRLAPKESTGRSRPG